MYINNRQLRKSVSVITSTTVLPGYKIFTNLLIYKDTNIFCNFFVFSALNICELLTASKQEMSFKWTSFLDIIHIKFILITLFSCMEWTWKCNFRKYICWERFHSSFIFHCIISCIYIIHVNDHQLNVYYIKRLSQSSSTWLVFLWSDLDQVPRNGIEHSFVGLPAVRHCSAKI